MRVRDLMHRGALVVDDDASVTEVARIMRDEDVGAVLVSAEGELVGIVTDRDLVCRAIADGADPAATSVREVMSRRPVCCAPTDDLEDVIELMETNRIRRVPVMDEDALVGMLSLGDLTHRVHDAQAGEVLRHVAAPHA